MGQDVHFSQFFHSPLTVSPSNTGNFDGDWRISSNYRSQWRRIDKPYLTQSFGFDKQFYVHNEQLSGGLFIVNDKSGGSLNVFKLYGAAAYHKKIARHHFHAGFQGGYVSKRINPNEETFPDQWDWGTGQFNQALPNNEYELRDGLHYLDLNAGFGYHYKTDKINPYLSMAFFHVNKPNESFFDKGSTLAVRQVLNGGFYFKTGKKIALEPCFIYMSTIKATGGSIGSNIHFLMDENPLTQTSVFTGIFFRDGFERNSDALFFSGGLKYKRYTVGISYDHNISELRNATDSRGAFEIAFIYTGLNTRLKKIEIPCDRY
jgi:type IX secretion system PorP/SprF family membrane protein